MSGSPERRCDVDWLPDSALAEMGDQCQAGVEEDFQLLIRHLGGRDAVLLVGDASGDPSPAQRALPCREMARQLFGEFDGPRREVREEEEGDRAQSDRPSAPAAACPDGKEKEEEADGRSQGDRPRAQPAACLDREEEEGSGAQSNRPGTQPAAYLDRQEEEGSGAQSDTPEAQAAGCPDRQEEEGGRAQSDRPEAQAAGCPDRQEEEGGRAQSDRPEAQAAGCPDRQEEEGGRAQSDGPEAQAAGCPDRQEEEGGRAQSDGLEAQAAACLNRQEEEGGRAQSDGLEAQAAGCPDRQEEEGGRAQSDRPEAQAAGCPDRQEEEGSGAQSDTPEAQAAGCPDRQEEEGGRAQSDGLEAQAAACPDRQEEEGGRAQSTRLEAQAAACPDRQEEEGGRAQSDRLEAQAAGCLVQSRTITARLILFVFRLEWLRQRDSRVAVKEILKDVRQRCKVVIPTVLALIYCQSDGGELADSLTLLSQCIARVFHIPSERASDCVSPYINSTAQSILNTKRKICELLTSSDTAYRACTRRAMGVKVLMCFPWYSRRKERSKQAKSQNLEGPMSSAEVIGRSHGNRDGHKGCAYYTQKARLSFRHELDSATSIIDSTN